ncbi:hypothetical protein M405DRAFT_870409 [Rhizopogon salebrosus TDB-379]|nr:hypothetical protein M405DRAFT_870409 [Rhizopogon salebrosus TDB-379]
MLLTQILINHLAPIVTIVHALDGHYFLVLIAQTIANRPSPVDYIVHTPHGHAGTEPWVDPVACARVAAIFLLFG